jgi:ABC-type amino acid transport substrate-binding protein
MITSPEYSDLTFCDMEVENTYDAYCIALRKNSPMTLKKFNSTIDALILDGTLATISNKYFGNTDLLV